MHLQFQRGNIIGGRGFGMNLDCTKKTGGEISAKLLKLSSNVVCPIIRDSINQCFRTGRFPNCLKKAEIIPIPKKGDSQYVSDYRPISYFKEFGNCWKNFQQFPNSLKNQWQTSFLDSSMANSQIFFTVSARNTLLNML